uniref:AAA+ ATPase domain-containing protein n=1 Tax=Ophidocladus simpliciusculus TaxID=1261574 RepID=A0A1Z1MJS9_9FLOR|nr:hypothetical protein [Ophidocladus simpliciusculus]ARW66021.1 hypothetical protein [Ophidocladus simpliciusculus]
MLIADDLDKLLNIFPDFVKNPLKVHPDKKVLIEVVMDLGRRPEARFPYGPEYLSTIHISWNDLDFCIKRIPHFSSDNRSGIESTLHRISSIKNRKGNIIGLTCRVGRAIFGTVGIIRDLLYNRKSLLLLGRPGVGKTTVLREITRVLADEMQRRVVIIDTSNEIAGDGDIPHPAIGRARRMQVTKPELQHQVMIEAVENHMPEVIIIDEIGTELEALAARTIAERGVQLVGTAHGNYLDSVIKNPTLSDLIGGIQYVTLGDDEAKRRGSQKSILERKTFPAFQVAIEIHHRSSWIIHEKVELAVDQILQRSFLSFQRRKFNYDGSIVINFDTSNNLECTKSYDNNSIFNRVDNVLSYSKVMLSDTNFTKLQNFNQLSEGVSSSMCLQSDMKITSHQASFNSKSSIFLYVYGINIQKVEEIRNAFQLPIILTRDVMKANCILARRSYVKHVSKVRQIAKSNQLIIYTIHNSNNSSILRALKKMLNLQELSYVSWYKLCICRNIDELNALCEVRYAIEKIILVYKQSVLLLPQINSIRKLQSKLINMYNLKYSNLGNDRNKRIIIYPIFFRGT